MTDDIFMKAAKEKLRFETVRGDLTVEQLWDIPMTSDVGKTCLNSIAGDLYEKLNSSSASFSLAGGVKKDERAQLAFDIVKAVFEARTAENQARAAAAERLHSKRRIVELIAEKKDESLKGKSLEELEALLAGL